MIQYQNFWLNKRKQASTSGEIPNEVDAFVIGGGFNGISTAFHLAKMGVKVLLAEQEFVGWGGSGRNGGMVLTGLKEDVLTLRKKYGLELAKRYFDASKAAIDLVEELSKTEMIQCDFHRSGHLEAAVKSSHFSHMVHMAETLNKDFDHSVRLITKAQLSNEIMTEFYCGGVVDDFSGEIDPYLFVTGMAEAARKAGASIQENTKVEKIVRQGDKYQVTIGKMVITARIIVIATGAYTNGNFPDLEKKMAKIGSYIAVTQRYPGKTLKELLPKGRMVFDSKNFLYYFRPTSDDRLLFGGRAAFGREPESMVRESLPILREGIRNVFPELVDPAIEYAWGGTLDVTSNKLPVYFEQNNLYFSIGFAGHGVALATLIGKLIAEKILNGTNSIFERSVIPDMPLAQFRNTYLPLMGIYLQAMDRFW